MRLEPGKLFKINKYFWLLFPTQETAAAAVRRGEPVERRDAAGAVATVASRADARSALDWASYWSKELNCNVSFLSEGDTLMVVDVSGIQVKVINQEGKGGWINFPADEEWAGRCIVACDVRPP